jgi:hypothetical protein
MSKTATTPVDVSVANEGTIFLFTLHTNAAREWVAEHVQLESYQWMGNSSFGVEHRYALDLAAGMQSDGLTVQ